MVQPLLVVVELVLVSQTPMERGCENHSCIASSRTKIQVELLHEELILERDEGGRIHGQNFVQLGAQFPDHQLVLDVCVGMNGMQVGFRSKYRL